MSSAGRCLGESRRSPVVETTGVERDGFDGSSEDVRWLLARGVRVVNRFVEDHAAGPAERPDLREGQEGFGQIQIETILWHQRDRWLEPGDSSQAGSVAKDVGRGLRGDLPDGIDELVRVVQPPPVPW